MRSEVRILSGAMFVVVQAFGPIMTNSVLIGCERSREAALFDVPFGAAKPLLAKIEELNLSLSAIYLTHAHWDHIGDLALLHRKTGAPIFVHPLEAENVRTPGADGLPLPLPLEGCTDLHLLEEGMFIKVGELEGEVIHTPGHSPGGVCFYFEKEKLLVAGDTLFKGTIGRLDLPTSSAEKMWPSLGKLAKLPPATRVISGHGPETSIGAERWLARAKEYFGE